MARKSAIIAEESGSVCSSRSSSADCIWVAPSRRFPRKAAKEPISARGSADPGEPFNEVRSVAYSPDGKTLAVTGFARAVQLWDVVTGERTHLLKGHTRWAQAVAFSPDGRAVASGGNDQTIKLWDSQTGALRATLTGHQAAVTAVAFSPVGQRLASASDDSTIRFWDLGKATADSP